MSWQSKEGKSPHGTHLNESKRARSANPEAPGAGTIGHFRLNKGRKDWSRERATPRAPTRSCRKLYHTTLKFSQPRGKTSWKFAVRVVSSREFSLTNDDGEGSESAAERKRKPGSLGEKTTFTRAVRRECKPNDSNRFRLLPPRRGRRHFSAISLVPLFAASPRSAL